MTVRIEELNSKPASRRGRFKISKFHEQIVMDICEYVHANLDKDLTLKALATRSGYSRSHFARCFSRIHGKSLQAYVAHARVDAAAALLRDTNHTVLAIMHRVGYQSSGSFSQVFRARTGYAPATYRNVAREAQEARRQLAQDGLQE